MKKIVALFVIVFANTINAQDMDRKCLGPTFVQGLKDSLSEKKFLETYNQFRQTKAATLVLNKKTYIKKGMKLLIGSKEWVPSRDKMSGVIIGRHMNTLIFLQDPIKQDHCETIYVQFTQNYDGKDYSSVTNVFIGNHEKVKCDCIK